jgi:hypothetical protein
MVHNADSDKEAHNPAIATCTIPKDNSIAEFYQMIQN